MKRQAVARALLTNIPPAAETLRRLELSEFAPLQDTSRMDHDERAIKLFLKSYPGQYVSPRIICRRVGDKRTYAANPLWALPILGRMLEKGIVETDAQGHYRLMRVERDQRKRVWVAPDIQQVLERSSKDFAQLHDLDGETEPSP